MSCYAQVIGCVVFLIGNILVNNDLVKVIEGYGFPGLPGYRYRLLYWRPGFLEVC
jgi:hypothetical protein